MSRSSQGHNYINFVDHESLLIHTKLSADMNMIFMSVNERLDKIDSGFEKRIATKVSQILDKRVNSEMNKIRTDFESRLVE